MDSKIEGAWLPHQLFFAPNEGRHKHINSEDLHSEEGGRVKGRPSATGSPGLHCVTYSS